MERSGFTGIAGTLLVIVGLAIGFFTGAPPASLLGGLACGIGVMLIALIVLRPVRQPAPIRPEEPAPAPFSLEDLLGAIGDPLLLVEDRFVVHANPPALATLGPHVIGEDVRLAIRHPAAAELLARGDEGRAGSVELVGLGGGERHWTLTVEPVRGGRRLVRLVDRTEGRATEKMRVDFVANASHELRTPLASLIGFIETLEDANGPADAAVRRRFLAIMAGEARRMQRLVDDLISLSRIEADRHRAPGDAVALGPLAREAADALGEAAKRLEITAVDGLPAVAGDRVQLSQLIHNLVGNALKYGDPNRPVRLSVDRTAGGMIRLIVADEGEGIQPQHLPRLTERFYRVDPGRSRAVGGTGLGLAIVKHIVERHRGRLDIASAPGRGTRVTVLLPAIRDTAGPPVGATGTLG